ncbi:Dehydrogenase/reductase SDR member 12 [Sparganum proliferum]
MSLYRNLAFFLKGVREFTRAGYERAAHNFNPDELKNVDLQGKRAIVTGANSGIGLCCAMELVRRHAEVHLVCRNPERAEIARKSIVDETANQNVHVHIVDLSQPREVSKFCSEFASSHSSLDTLINNAGCMVNKRSLNGDGLEVNFATNTLGTFIMTTSLLPLLKKSSDPRVIVVSSGGMLTQRLNATDPALNCDPIANEAFDGTMVYAQNKRQQVVMTEMWAKQNPEVFFAAMHPGWADTPAVATSMPSFHQRMQGRLRTPEQGADTAVWLAMTPRLREFENGTFFLDRQPAPKHLTLARTHSTLEEQEEFMQAMHQLAEPFMKH